MCVPVARWGWQAGWGVGGETCTQAASVQLFPQGCGGEGATVGPQGLHVLGDFFTMFWCLILNSKQASGVEAERLGLFPRFTQSVNGSEDAQVIKQKTAAREALEGTQSRWGMELSLQSEGPEREGLGEKNGRGGSTLDACCRHHTWTSLTRGAWHLFLAQERLLELLFLQSCAETISLQTLLQCPCGWLSSFCWLILSGSGLRLCGRQRDRQVRNPTSPVSHRGTQTCGEF